MNSKLLVALALVLAVNSAVAVEGNEKYQKIYQNISISRIRNPINLVSKWTFSDGNITCLIVQMNIQVNFTYKAMGKWNTGNLRSNLQILLRCEIFLLSSALWLIDNEHKLILFCLSQITQAKLCCIKSQRTLHQSTKMEASAARRKTLWRFHGMPGIISSSTSLRTIRNMISRRSSLLSTRQVCSMIQLVSLRCCETYQFYLFFVFIHWKFQLIKQSLLLTSCKMSHSTSLSSSPITATTIKDWTEPILATLSCRRFNLKPSEPPTPMTSLVPRTANQTSHQTLSPLLSESAWLP